MKQHTKPCKECPFRRESPAGYLGGNNPKHFSMEANTDGDMLCHLTFGKENRPQCAGRAIMWSNSGKTSRDKSVPRLNPDREKVFTHIAEFNKHHGIDITPLQLMGLEEI